MKTFNLISASLITAALMISTSSLVWAHSEHSDRPLPLVWKFDHSVQDKIDRAMTDEVHKNKVGLSHLEQRILERYGIRVGYSFFTPVNGQQVQVKRTLSGLKIMQSNSPITTEFRLKAPVTDRYQVVPSSFSAMTHPGHHHHHLNRGWLFDTKIAVKIKRHLSKNSFPIQVGLSKTEQKIVDRYEIQTGNSFIATISGEDYLVKRTSSGLQIMKKMMEDAPIAATSASPERNTFKG